ncbi:MAG: hypothetical protein HON48_17840 [Desulfobacula sp.]|nr:hypothetical protein [Desulfobacula sp.]
MVLRVMQDGKTGNAVTAAITALFFKKHRLLSMEAAFLNVIFKKFNVSYFFCWNTKVMTGRYFLAD